MKEDLLHYIWKTRAYQSLDLTTVDGDKLIILNTGVSNVDAGPDFLNARIQIGKTLWAGHVEIHVSASDWKAHHHDNDPLYQNVILHVVYNHDVDVYLKRSKIPVLELNGKVAPILFHRYEKLIYRQSIIKCGYQSKNVPNLIWTQIIDRKVIERLDQKRERINQLLTDHNGDWEQSTLIVFARYFGGQVNVDNFQALFERIPVSLIRKYKDDLIKLEALLFGVAGMLEQRFHDDYPRLLKSEYSLLKHLHKLDDSFIINWKFSRMRPAGFPTIRLAQLAMVIHKFFPLVNSFLELKTYKDFFHFIQPTSYWESHYLFDKTTKSRKKRIGKAFNQHLFINVIVPVIYSYGIYYGNSNLVTHSIELLNSIPSEENKIIGLWKALGVQSASATDSQALIQLFHNDCSESKCLNCQICHNILKKKEISMFEEKAAYLI